LLYINVAMNDNRAGIICETCGIGHASGVGAGGFCPFVTQTYRTGDELYAEGDAVHHVWFVKQGTVVLSRRRSDERGDRVRTVRFAGGFVGIEALVSPVYIDTARVASGAVLCQAPAEGFEQWLGSKEQPARTALESSVRAMVADLPPRAAADGSAEQRVAEWLTHESQNTLQLPRRVIADLLGMRPETLSRALASLAARGAIAVTRTDLKIVDEQALTTIARTG
jgi:CRP-like cAMP-binding protein